MNIKVKVIAFSLICVSLCGCLKQPGFNDYTPTDVNGVPMTDPDPTDWTYDSKWTAAEKNLFSKEAVITDTSLVPGIISVQPVWPNPCEEKFFLQVENNTKVQAKFILVNAQLKKIANWDAIVLDSGYTVKYYGIGGIHGKYRLYYSFSAYGEEEFYKGHGDIRFE